MRRVVEAWVVALRYATRATLRNSHRIVGTVHSADDLAPTNVLPMTSAHSGSRDLDELPKLVLGLLVCLGSLEQGSLGGGDFSEFLKCG